MPHLVRSKRTGRMLKIPMLFERGYTFRRFIGNVGWMGWDVALYKHNETGELVLELNKNSKLVREKTITREELDSYIEIDNTPGDDLQELFRAIEFIDMEIAENILAWRYEED